jgi:NTE family protein
MKEIALALGGGGVRGIAHVGVIQALLHEGFSIKAIAGTSAGGIVGAAYASGLSTDDIIAIAGKINNPKLFALPQANDPSILGLAGLEKELINSFRYKLFEELPIKFGCTAVEINTAQEYIFTNGKIVDAVMASIAVPGIFPPKVIGNYTFVDGGILDPVPVALARYLAPNLPIIAVCLTPVPDEWCHMPPMINPPQSSLTKPIIDQFSKLRLGKAFNIFTHSIDITSRMLAELRMKIDKPDIVLRPRVDEIGLISLAPTSDLVAKGQQSVYDALKEINRMFGVTKQVVRMFNQPIAPGKKMTDTDLL